MRVRDGELLVTDGPYTESREWIAGFGILDCDTLEEAIELARRNPMPWEGRIELRPIHSMVGPEDRVSWTKPGPRRRFAPRLLPSGCASSRA